MNLHAGFLREQILYVCNNVAEAELKSAAEYGLLVSVDSLAHRET
jgi:diaminopimelate decarboxylase